MSEVTTTKKSFNGNNNNGTVETDFQIVPKIVFGIDKMDNAFIYFKLKDFKRKDFLREYYVIMYQSVKNKKNSKLVKERMNSIIDFVKENFDVGEIRSFNDKNHFYIKRKLFPDIEKVRHFYINMAKKLLVRFPYKEMKPDAYYADDNSYLTVPALFNYYK